MLEQEPVEEISYDWDDIFIRAVKTMGQTGIAVPLVAVGHALVIGDPPNWAAVKLLVIPTVSGLVSFAWNTFTSWNKQRKAKAA